MVRVREMTIRLVVLDDVGPAMDVINELITDEHTPGGEYPDWLLLVEGVSEERREATAEEVR